MTATADDLRDYYAALTEVTDQHAKLERLQKALLGVPLDEQDLAQIKTAHDELQKRCDMAESLSGLAEAYSGLARSEASAKVSQSAANLGSTLSTIQTLPGSSYAPEVLQHAGELLTKLAQTHDEKRMTEYVGPAITALSEMYSQEKPVYESINRTYIELAQSLALELIQRNQVDVDSLVVPALKPFGLTSRNPEEMLSPGLQDYAREQIQERGQAEVTAHAAASAGMEKALKELSQTVHELASRGQLSKTGPTAHHSSVEHWTTMVPVN
ncbi:MAG TPA: hypothetical protein VHT24_09670 [Pseudacidobacterium sp.]|jgi:hypothetical protein|nr:hypothetical protein [Pseudacidobacterium sp.]